MSNALTIDDLYPAIQALPLPERLRLVERVAHDAAADSEMSESARQSQLDTWDSEVEQLAVQIPSEDFDRIDAALEEADREAKVYVRRQMGLS